MSKVFITGATGFLGTHTVDALLQAGHEVTALCRGPAEALAARGVDIARGDVLDSESVKAAIEGHDYVIHGAGFVSRDKDDAPQMMRVHVEGTRVVLEAAVAAKVKRVVHLSTSGVVAVGDDDEVVFHEDDPVPFALLLRWPYYLSKWLSERAADDAVRGTETELITLNPSLVLGPGDARRSSTADVERFLNREIPLVPPGGVSFVDARDVADVAVQALEKGRSGERYLLGAVNLTFQQFFDRLSQVSGVSGPWVPIKMPPGLARAGVSLLSRALKTVGAEAPVSEVEADMASRFWYVDARKAEDELDWSPRDPMVTLLDTVKDIRQ